MTYFKTRGLVLILFVCCFREVILVMHYRFTSWALGSIRVRGGGGGERRLKLRGSPNHWAAEITLARLPASCLRHRLILVLSDPECVSPSLRLFSVSSSMCFSFSLLLFLPLSFSPVFLPLSVPGFDQNSP